MTKLKLRKRVRSLITDPNKNFSNLKPRLKDLQSELSEVLKEANGSPLDAVVMLFAKLSAWQGHIALGETIKVLESVNYGQYHRLLKRLVAIQNGISAICSDDLFSNRSGEDDIGDENIFFGGIYGLRHQPISFWKGRVSAPRGALAHYPELKSLNTYDIASIEAKKLVDKKVLPLSKLLNRLLK